MKRRMKRESIGKYQNDKRDFQESNITNLRIVDWWMERTVISEDNSVNGWKRMKKRWYECLNSLFWSRRIRILNWYWLNRENDIEVNDIESENDDEWRIIQNHNLRIEIIWSWLNRVDKWNEMNRIRNDKRMTRLIMKTSLKIVRVDLWVNWEWHDD